MAPTSTSEIEIEPVTAAEEQSEIESRGIDASDAEAAIVGGEEAADVAGEEGGEAGGEDEDEGEGDGDGDGDGEEEEEDEEGEEGEGEGEEEAAAEEPKTTKKRVKGEKKEKRGKKAPKIGLDKQFEAAFKANKDALDDKRQADLESRAARGAARARATAA